jgi:hypothetical protein
MARVHGTLVDHDSGEIVKVLGGVDTLLVLLHGVREHVEGKWEVDVAIHFLGGGLVVFIALREMSELSSFHQILEVHTFSCMHRMLGSLLICSRFDAR